MVRRVCRELGNKKNIIVINDEAHHCYRRKPDGEDEKLTGDERIEAKKRDEEARVWISGLEAVKAKIGVKAIYDLSATPFFLRGSGYPEGTLFPWVVSDFSLIDAIEAGIVKVPRVPVADDSMTGEQPTYRDLWLRIREHLPKKGRKTEAVGGEPKLPVELQGALHSLYSNYEKYYRLWEQNAEARARGITPPVFIVVCNNTNVSKLVFDYIAGWEKPIGEQTVVQAGQLPIFRNDDGNGGWLHRPNTILVDSQQLESGEAMSDDFKKIAAREIDEFKAEYRVRFPGRDADSLTDEDLLREVMNTVGKAGKLGEHVKCVVSVSMLTEGWDANTVTHILGVRAFGTQLLCEQVVGRALRRMSYAANDEGRFEPEYAEVYGVPFSFIPCSGATADPKPGPMPTRVRALESRIACEITFPRLLGYRYDIAGERLTATFTPTSCLAPPISTLPLILLVALAGIAGCANDDSPDVMVSPPGWVVVPSGGQHATSATLTYIANGGTSSCAECHGADLSGGTSKVSCFGNPAGCHHGPVAGWVAAPPAAQSHGVAAKKAPGSSGFASCQVCHGNNYSDTAGGPTCLNNAACHGAGVVSPHARKPWRGSPYTHINANAENAPVCVRCHFPGSPNNPANHPATPAAAGTPPGCFNSTLCHGPTTAPHAVGTAWRDPNPQFHGLTAKQDISFCQGCHGTPGTTLFNGGTAPTSCQTSTCHAQAKAHPTPWHQAPQPFPAYVASHRDSGNRSAACAICHAVDGPGTGPDPNAPSCFSVSFGGITCHSGGPGGVNHSVPFPGATHTSADQASFNADCSACHAITGVSPSSVAPLCTVCHRSATALPFTNCSSCHARPPSGTAYPDVAGSHARHDALANVTGVCDPCHNGLGTGTAGHYDRANARPGKDALRVPPGEAAFLSVYNAKAGPAAFDNATLACANVSCHGGVTAPNWRTGSIDGNTDTGCRQCHRIGAAAGNPESNSPFSGLHAAHLSTTVGGAILCTDCHNMSNGTAGALNHYKFLDTPQMEGPAGDTVAPNGSAANYVAANQTCGTFTCHTIVHVNFSWSGGTSHSVPFTGANHTSVTSSNFAANCGACHSETAPSTKVGPTCRSATTRARRSTSPTAPPAMGIRRRRPARRIRTRPASTQSTVRCPVWGSAPRVTTDWIPAPWSITTEPMRDRARTRCGCPRAMSPSWGRTTPSPVRRPSTPRTGPART